MPGGGGGGDDSALNDKNIHDFGGFERNMCKCLRF